MQRCLKVQLYVDSWCYAILEGPEVTYVVDVTLREDWGDTYMVDVTLLEGWEVTRSRQFLDNVPSLQNGKPIQTLDLCPKHPLEIGHGLGQLVGKNGKRSERFVSNVRGKTVKTWNLPDFARDFSTWHQHGAVVPSCFCNICGQYSVRRVVFGWFSVDWRLWIATLQCVRTNALTLVDALRFATCPVHLTWGLHGVWSHSRSPTRSNETIRCLKVPW